MGIDVTKNNYLLAGPWEEYLELCDPVIVQSLQIQADHEVPVIFHQLNREHWVDWFNHFTNKELMVMIRHLGLWEPRFRGQNKTYFVGYLANHYYRRTDAGLSTHKI
jgi:hypothetical protein